MNLEPLRELERKWRAESVRRDESAFEMENEDPESAGWNHGVSAGMDDCADDLSRAIAQLDDGWVLVPRTLTAENGAKAALIGEFSFRDGLGNEHNVPWHTIKDIHKAMVAHFSPLPPSTRTEPATMSHDDELRGIDHIEALRLLRVGVKMDAAYDPEAQSKLAALDAAIALLTRTEAAPVADGAVYHPAFDMPTTPEQALAWLTKQGDPTCMTFDHRRAARAAQLLSDALTRPSADPVIGTVTAEIERAVRKFPTWPTDPLHAVAVLGEEFGELTKAVLQSVYEPHKVQPGEVRAEAVQTAAMALRFLRSLDVYAYERGEQHAQDAAMSAAARKGE